MVYAQLITLILAILFPFLLLDELQDELYLLAQSGMKLLAFDQNKFERESETLPAVIEPVKAPYVSKSKHIVQDIDILKEIRSLIQEINWNDPKTQSTIISISLIVILAIVLIKWIFSKNKEEITEVFLQEPLNSEVYNIEISSNQLMDICTVDDKAILEELQILESYSSSNDNSGNIYTPSSSPDSFERHETLLDESQALKLKNTFSSQFDTTSITSTSTSKLCSTNNAYPGSPSPTRSSVFGSSSPSKLVFQSSNFSIIKQFEKSTQDIATVGDVTQETVYSTSFSNSDHSSKESNIDSASLLNELKK